MGGRVTDNGERRRDLNRPRKTMKFLLNGYFQWTAFNVETFKFLRVWRRFHMKLKKKIILKKLIFFLEIIPKLG